MKLLSIDVMPVTEAVDTTWGRLGLNRIREPQLTGELHVRIRLQAETILDMPEDLDRAGLISWILAALTPAMKEEDPPTESAPLPSRIGSSSGSSERSPVIVVSVRPDIEGAPSMSMTMASGATESLPLQFRAITQKGELVDLTCPLEIRASVH